MSKSDVIDRDLGWRELVNRAKALSGKASVKVGVLADSAQGGLHETLPNGKASPLTVAEIAAVNEFGTKDGHVPSRPFLRTTFDRMREELANDAAQLLVRVVVDGSPTVAQALSLLGAKLSAAAKRTITDGAGVPPPNAPSTIAAKGSERPLVNRGRLVGAITWALEGLVVGQKEHPDEALTEEQARRAGLTIETGPRGGRFYRSSTGSKVYVKRRP